MSSISAARMLRGMNEVLADGYRKVKIGCCIRCNHAANHANAADEAQVRGFRLIGRDPDQKACIMSYE